jgi:hypothetical protein
MVSVVVKLTEGNIKNHSIRIRKVAGFFPSNTIGGSSKEMMAARTITIDWGDGESVETDIAGDKMIFRKRKWVGDFIQRYQLQPGDEVIITRIAEYKYRIRPATN